MAGDGPCALTPFWNRLTFSSAAHQPCPRFRRAVVLRGRPEAVSVARGGGAVIDVADTAPWR